jgi:hypothetical protein
MSSAVITAPGQARAAALGSPAPGARVDLEIGLPARYLQRLGERAG